MDLLEFLDSHDKALIALANIEVLIVDESSLVELSELIPEIEGHIKRLELHYLNQKDGEKESGKSEND